MQLRQLEEKPLSFLNPIIANASAFALKRKNVVERSLSSYPTTVKLLAVKAAS